MNNKILFLLIALITTSAQASEIYTSGQRSINAQNAYIMTGDIFYGPVKSIQATHIMPDNKDGKTDDGTVVSKFSNCNKLLEFNAGHKK